MDSLKGLSRGVLEAFFFSERPVYVRNISKETLHFKIPREHSIARNLHLDPGKGWVNLPFPFIDMSRSADLKNLLVKTPRVLDLWTEDGAPLVWKSFYDWNDVPEENVVENTVLSPMDLNLFFSKERDVFVRNLHPTAQICFIVGALDSSRSFLIPKGSRWYRLSVTSSELKESLDFRKLLLRKPPILQLWQEEGCPEEYDILSEGGFGELPEKDEQDARIEAEADRYRKESAARWAIAGGAGRTEAANLMDITFDKVFASFSDERDALLKQVDFHKKSLSTVEERLAEVDPVYGVLLWLKNNVFGTEFPKGLVQAALRGEAPTSADDDFTLPSTYKSMMEYVSRLDEIKIRGGGSMRGAMMNFASSEAPLSDTVLKTKKGPGRPKKVLTETVLVPPKEKKSFRRSCKCDLCDFKAKGLAGLGAHKKHKHHIQGSSVKALARLASLTKEV